MAASVELAAHIDVVGTVTSRFRTALLNGRLHVAWTRLRPIDSTFPVARAIRRQFHRCESVTRTLSSLSAVSHAHVNEKRPLPAVLTQKSTRRHCCRGVLGCCVS
jgi:hypothetical protein